MKHYRDPHDPLHQRGLKARQNLVNALRECGELADAVENFDGAELLEVLDYLDSLRFVMAESGQLLGGVVRGELSEG
jgi:hypothetical protein